ncbi:MAG: GntR family transcriptional regulator [Eubacterium sp.]|nr:GntR family transcriptional regulator [Eubacterium sp.]
MENEKVELSLDMSSCKPLREIVFETIRNAIINGDLKPGQRLMEVQLAEQLGVSRTPVRESIRKLELEGLVKMVPRKGAYVTPMSIEDLKDMMEIRRALEALAAELAAKNANDADVKKLRESNKDFEEAACANDETGIINHDIAFHETIYEATGNKRLCQMINSLREQMQRVRVEYVHHVEDKRSLTGQHQRIIDNIEKHLPAEASAAAAEHIHLAELDMVAVLEKDE